MSYLEPEAPIGMHLHTIHPVRPEYLHARNLPPRTLKLRAWIEGQIEMSGTPVSLPESDLHLSIFHPTDASREELFEVAKASEDRQLPYWADIWPSGLALASVALQRSDELAGMRVLELGSGLGTTAAATLKAGASVLALDYSQLALALCRYNALMNVGVSPRTLPANWRNLRASTLTRLEAAGPFPIIMASDVLYESRDIEPLIDLIDRLLAPEGQLWISEPRRKVAGRFLDTLALRGWRFTTREMSWQRPEGPATINVHFLRRELSSIRPYGIVGGWRV